VVVLRSVDVSTALGKSETSTRLHQPYGRLAAAVRGEHRGKGLKSTDDLSFDIFGKVAKSARALAMIAPVTTLKS
jgi:hypothetical protein